MFCVHKTKWEGRVKRSETTIFFPPIFGTSEILVYSSMYNERMHAIVLFSECFYIECRDVIIICQIILCTYNQCCF